eukprot:CAMPEP_0195524542 /NCGR_PEP_ID=MMETSP0794_2-20130614/24449_1 /TAXON_ID=515487 /ORGANISM="Stephanopyxis turris, Strain CCMP 815" /LENGTH=106 /DNA_ID=CAMNT_0040654787 /DNA_START=103 /DNA_END=420 /DNA_ORIENTATION=-
MQSVVRASSSLVRCGLRQNVAKWQQFAEFHNYGAVFVSPTRGKRDEHWAEVAVREHERAVRDDRFAQRAAKHRYYVKGTQRKYLVAQANHRRASMRSIARDIEKIN